MRFMRCILGCVWLPLLLIEHRAFGSEVNPAMLRQAALSAIPLDQVKPSDRAKVEEVLQNSELFVRGPIESFPCKPAIYRWLLDHPEWGVHAWRHLGATQIQVERQKDNSFLGQDQSGGELRWRLVHEASGKRVWYAEGSGRMAPFTPIVTIRAVLLLRYQEVMAEDGRVGIRHRSEVFAMYDPKSAALIRKFLQSSSETLGKKVLEQIELFFSGMAWYLTENPDWGQQVMSTRATDALKKAAYERLAVELRTLPSRGSLAQPSAATKK